MSAAIRLVEAGFIYPDGCRALAGVSLDIAPGRCVAIVGPNGSGKSTLLQLLNGALAANPGRVEVDGLPVERSTLREIRRRVGLVFQDPDMQLFSPTVGEDIAFGLLNLGLPRDEIPGRVAEALRFVGLEGFEARSPFHLSGGEKKLVSLATVLAMQPPVVALDEPTAALDPWHRRLILDLLGRVPGTRVLATHDLDLALAVADEVVVLFRGNVVARGPATEILRDESLLIQHRLELPLCLQCPRCHPAAE